MSRENSRLQGEECVNVMTTFQTHKRPDGRLGVIALCGCPDYDKLEWSDVPVYMGKKVSPFRYGWTQVTKERLD